MTAAGPGVRGPGHLGRGEPGHGAAAALLHPAAVRVLAGLQAHHQVTSINYQVNIHEINNCNVSDLTSMSPSGTTSASEQRGSCGCRRSGTQAVTGELSGNKSTHIPQHPEPGVRHEAGSPQRVRGAAGERGRHHQPVQVIIIIIICNHHHHHHHDPGPVCSVVRVTVSCSLRLHAYPHDTQVSRSPPISDIMDDNGEVGFVHGPHYNLFEFVESS